MTINGNVQAIAQTLGIQPPADLLHHINEQIEAELSSLSLFDDVIPTLNVLQTRGIRIGICSNLAQPYGAVIDRLLADFDVELFLSYELGRIKPEAQIYQAIFNRFSCTAEQCLFVGDTFEADYERIYGNKGYQGHDYEHKYRVFKSGQKQGVKGMIKKELKRRSVVEPIIGHLKSDHALGRNFLKAIDGDKINALLAGIGYNFRWLRFFCFKIGVYLWALFFKNSKSGFYRFALG